MAEVLLFHHAQGLTAGVLAFADDLRGAGHSVHTPDLYDGRTFETLDEGLGYANEIGFGALFERGVKAAEGLPAELVYAGFSLGVMPAQALAQTRPGARGALLFYSAVPVSEFGPSWPDGVPVQIHGMDADPTSMLRARSSTRPRMRSCSSTPAISTSSRTARCRRMTRTRPGSCGSGCSTSSAPANPQHPPSVSCAHTVRSAAAAPRR